MTPYHFSMNVSPGGTAHAFVLHRGVFVASRTFKPGELNELPAWLADSSIWTRDLAYATVNAAISYDHHDGMIHLSTALGVDNKYDPNNEEHLARMVRLLKRKAAAPPEHAPAGSQPTLPDLPIPTAADMARRVIATNIGIPSGVEGYRPHKPKPRFQQPAVSAAKSREIVSALLADFGFE